MRAVANDDLVDALEATPPGTPAPGGRDRHLGEALQFFFDDTPNVPTPLTRVVFPMGIVDPWYTPERTPACLWG